MFRRLPAEEQVRIQPLIRERIFHRGDVLLVEGMVAASVRVVRLGLVFGYRRGLDGRLRPIGVVSRGAALGIFGTLDTPSQATCVASTTVRICDLALADLRRLCDCSACLLAQVVRSVTETFAALTAWSEAMRLPGTINQLAYVLVLLADANKSAVVELPSHAALADLLGTRRETVARALRMLESEGGIRRHERRRCVVNRAALLGRLPPGRA